MKDIKQEVDKFLEEFTNAPMTETLRNALSFSLSQEGKIDLETIEEAKSVLNKWFKRKLYSLGRIVEHVKTIAKTFDYNTAVGIGYDVEAKKNKINIARYLLHLLLIIESRDRNIAYLQAEVLAAKQNYLEMENAISKVINNNKIADEIKNNFSKFYWLKVEED